MSEERKSFITKKICDYPPILQACHIMEITRFSNGKAYEVMRSKGCPTGKSGKRMIVLRDMFWEFILGEAEKHMTGDE